jgi:hypothetical protein
MKRKYLIKHYVLIKGRKILRFLIPRELRILSESLYTGFSAFSTKKIITTKDFPIYSNGDVAFYKYPFLEFNNNQYFAQVHGHRFVTDVTAGKRAYINYTSEIFTGKLCNKRTDISVDEDSVVPISIINKSTDARLANIDITTETGKIALHDLKHNRFHYLPIPAKKKISLCVDGDYILGDPLAMEQTIKTKKKLVITIFIDGLASAALKKKSFDKLMPNTYNYFKGNAMHYNGYANGIWTLPSVASIVSGLYVINHRYYRPDPPPCVGDGYTLMSDYFKNNGYLTSQICGCHRKGPNYNYCQGFDRTLYRFSMGCEEVVTNAMEQLRAFKNRSHYMWLTMFETHHFLHGIPDISNQVETDISLRNYRDRNTESPHLPPDLSKRTERYILELQRVDFYLKVLFNYIDDNYSDDEVVVSVCSDHGKTYLDDQPGRLAPHNIQVPMLFKSSDIKSRDETSIVENVDFLPSLLDLSGIEYNPDTLDGQSIFSNNYNKQHAITENIYPGDPYYVVVYSDNYTFHVKSDAPIKTIDDIDIYNCSYSIEDLSGDIIETGITSALQSALAKEQFSYLEKRQRS